ncbi:unnamed protein product [Leptosia nina]|uniref:DNA mismatch repair proteins mutS family domain-containing protein n=1 Tax=Leptosia nina TaxID=320188 RepID=A0AAV1JPU7_9NEOP
MNVVKRQTLGRPLKPHKNNDLVRRDCSYGIRTAITKPPMLSKTLQATRAITNAPRYRFEKNCEQEKQKLSMGPPPRIPPNVKRRLMLSSSRLDSTTSSLLAPRILANDSAAVDSFSTPKNRPTALRYISSSSRGGYSGTRSLRSASTSMVEASVILAISEGRGMARGEIGMAAIDLRHPHLVLCQFSDTLLYTHALTKINYFNPIEIIVPHTFCEGVQPSQLYQLIKDQYPLVNVTAVQRRHFNDSNGRQQIQSLCAPQYSAVYLQVLQKFYALTAAAAVLKYVEYIQCIVFARESLKIEYHSSEDTMIIDVGTATQLELVQPLVPSAGPTCCLLGVLGPTYTIGGIRALRAAILQPSCKREFIEARLDAVEELMVNDGGMMTSLQDIIKKLSEIDKILLLCIETQNQQMDKFGEAQLNQTLLLKTTMDVVPNLVDALKLAESGRLRKIKMDFENPHYKEISTRIREILLDDAHLEKGAMGSMQRCFAIKPDINGLLDVARRTYSELIDDIQKIVEQLSETYDLPIRLNQNIMKGFHIVLPVAPKNRRDFNVSDLPSVFIQVQFNGASVTMTTEELVVIDHQAKEALNEIQKMSNIVISALLKDLRPYMASLYKLCENVAELDIIIALTQISTVGSYIRPEFSDYMDIRNSVHPLLDYNSQVMPVSNDIFASPEHNFTIITGPNMGGKSIYIKQIAIMQVMAQLGCYLPATSGILRICDRLFSRIGFNDSVELNASTYVIEMKEIQHILKGLTRASLVIIDELCRGTCVEEGTSIAWAICEELILSDAFTFFTTHFLYLTKLEDLYYNVVNRHTTVSQEEYGTENALKRLIYTHKIELGTNAIDHYGLALAAKTSLPEETVNLAKELAEFITRQRKPERKTIQEKSNDRLLYEFNAKLAQDRRHNQNSTAIQKTVDAFKADNPQILEYIRHEKSNSGMNNISSITNLHTTDTSKYADKVSKSNIFEETRNDSSFVINNNLTINNSIHEINEIKKFKAVKSSTELLNTCFSKMPRNTLNDNHSVIDIDKEENIQNDISDIGIIAVNREQKMLEKSVSILNDTELSDKKITNSPNDELEICRSNTDDSDSELAQALTQVITENSDCESSDILSIDRELMRETVQEINDFIDLEHSVLTPPNGFRDDE